MRMQQQEANTSQPALKSENECMRDNAKSWWFQLARKEGTNKLPWDTFKERLPEQYNYLYKQADIREKLDEIKYRNADQFIDQFNRLIIKLHKDKITEWETSYLFTRPLPASLKTQMLQSGNGGYRGGALPFISFKKNPTYGNFGNKSLAQGRQHFGSQGGGHSRQASTSSQVVPMDLDVVDVSKAHCYNCNKVGHLSKDCSAPQKIKFGNFPKTNNGRNKQSLNLIDLDVPDGKATSGSLFAMEALQSRPAQQYIQNRLEYIARKIDTSLEKCID
ncbi:hypothetical protein PCANC_16205 [Puccinia coronata f. sp. avenae]|uniref:CCHC-type domain-containing protein n=1 Tax=Puccinia coronata f. sp. avenae TaxID=200324 RepID=A0A2N5UF46_9BASI|nr:hypothetical protein PCANC_16205 [Puccinia coronata f. sp. avenae]